MRDSFSHLRPHLVHAIKAAQNAAAVAAITSTPTTTALPSFIPSATPSAFPAVTSTALTSPSTSSLISRLHALLSHALSASPLTASYSSSFSLLYWLFHDCTRSYLVHLSSFYVSLFHLVCHRRHFPAFLRQHPLSASLLSFLRLALSHLRSSTSSTTSILYYLLAPGLYLRLLARHLLALGAFFFLHIFYQLCVHPTLTAAHSWLRSRLIHRSYLHKEEQLHARMEASLTYQQWKKAANALDRLQGQYRWKVQSRSPHYDWHRIRDDLAQFRVLVDSRDVRGIMTYSRARLYRNLVGINDRRLYSVLRAGTKRLIEEYISEVVRALQLVCVIESEDVSAADKLAFFNETRHAFGRSALLLSGGATLGLYHTGVIKALHDNHLLPRVLSGASVGSIVVAMLGTRTDEEIRRVFSEDAHLLRLDFFPHDAASTQRTLTRFLTTGTLMDINVLRSCVKANVPNLTFQEAYDRSGRIINIVVSPAMSSGNQDSLRLLNYLTAPNVLVWSAALASCAIPGIYAPVELMCLDESGKERKWLEGDVRWQDGSVQADLPMERLRELFNINNFIVSQVNPHVLPFLRPLSSSPSAYSPSLLYSILPRLIDFLSTSIKSTLLNLLSSISLPFQSPIRFMLDQTYVGDVTITPPITARDYSLLLKNPDAQRLHSCLRASEQATWKLMSMIRGACEIEMALDDGVRRMRGQLILQEVQEARKVERLSRVRSWSTDFERRKRELGIGGDEQDVDQEDSEDDSEGSEGIEEEGEEAAAAQEEGPYRPPPLPFSSAPHSHHRKRRGRRPLKSVNASHTPLSPEAPVRRCSAPAPSSAWMSPLPSVSTNHHAHSQPSTSHSSQLHLPSTTQEHAPYISGLAGKNMASVLAHRSTGESVAHAYVLANKSIKREALKRGATDGHADSVPATAHLHSEANGRAHTGTRTAANTPRRNGGRDFTSPTRSRTPPAPSSDVAPSYEELILSRQSSTRLQQLVRGTSKRTSPSLTRPDEPHPSPLSREHSAHSNTLPVPVHPSPSPSSDDSSHSMTVPSLVQFRPVERRHLSTLDLQRLGEADDTDGEDSDIEEEEKGWNEMMVRSDSDDDDGEDDDPVREERKKEGGGQVGSHPPQQSPPTAPATAPSSRFSYFTSLLPFQTLYRSRSSIDTRETTPAPQSTGSTTSRHSASHDANLGLVGLGRGEEMSRGEAGARGGRGGRASAGWKKMPRNLSLNEIAGDLSSIP